MEQHPPSGKTERHTLLIIAVVAVIGVALAVFLAKRETSLPASAPVVSEAPVTATSADDEGIPDDALPQTESDNLDEAQDSPDEADEPASAESGKGEE